MRCLTCDRFSWYVIYKNCLECYIQVQPRKRVLKGFKVYSFFDYGEVSFLIHSKYSLIGSRILKLLAHNAIDLMHSCRLLHHSMSELRGVGIDDLPRGGYSHTAIIARAFHQKASIKPIYGGVYATSQVKYVRKDFTFKTKNPRKFKVSFSPQDAPYGVILYDDVITAGTTMLEAFEAIRDKGIEVHCGFTLVGMSYQGASIS